MTLRATARQIRRTDLAQLYAALTPSEQRELDRLLAETTPPPPKTFRVFVEQVQPRIKWNALAEVIGRTLEQILAGRLTRVMIFAPVRHGKSELLSRLGTAYYLRHRPGSWVGLCAHTAELANLLSANSRAYYGRESLSRESYGKKHWETGHGGGMWAAGVGGPITGKGFDLGVIDDPVKNAKDAASEAVQQAQRDWYDSTFVTRQQTPQSAVVVITTRWNERDLVGHLLAQEADEPERWHIIDLPAIREKLEDTYPKTCTREPDPRKPGTALWPERWPLAELERRRRRYGEYWFSALYQQRPKPREGGMFKREWFDVVSSAPLEGPTIRYWDKAATEGAGDYTVGVKLRLHPNGTPYILDVVRGQWASGRRDKIIRQTAERDGEAVRQRAEQEPGASGKDAALAFVRLLAGYPASYGSASGDKELRAEPLASAASVHHIKLVRGDWNRAFIDELVSVFTGVHDDQADAASGAYNAVVKRKAPAVMPNVDDTEESYFSI